MCVEAESSFNLSSFFLFNLHDTLLYYIINIQSYLLHNTTTHSAITKGPLRLNVFMQFQRVFFVSSRDYRLGENLMMSWWHSQNSSCSSSSNEEGSSCDLWIQTHPYQHYLYISIIHRWFQFRPIFMMKITKYSNLDILTFPRITFIIHHFTLLDLYLRATPSITITVTKYTSYKK